MPRGGKRIGAGRRQRVSGDRAGAGHYQEQRGRVGRRAQSRTRQESAKIRKKSLAGASCGTPKICGSSLDVRKYLYDKRDGKSVQTVNHIHDKPIDLNVTHTLGERMLSAMAKAEKRLSDMNGKKK